LEISMDRTSYLNQVLAQNLSILLDQFKSLPVALLGAAAGVSIFTGGLLMRW